jgi:hypothetical protein
MEEPLVFSDEEFADVCLATPPVATTNAFFAATALVPPSPSSSTVSVASFSSSTSSSSSSFAFEESLKNWIYDPIRRDALVRETQGASTGACVSRMLREMFSEDTLAEHTYGGKRINGINSQGLMRKAATRQLLETVRASALVFSPSMKPVEFSNHVNDCCQKIRAKRKHAFEVRKKRATCLSSFFLSLSHAL